QVTARKPPADEDSAPKLYCMCLLAPDNTVPKSRFWYFPKKPRKVKKSAGEFVSLNVEYIPEKRPQKAMNFGIWTGCDCSHSGTHNMCKEYRGLFHTDAVPSLYQDMAARHCTGFRSIHILKAVEIEKASDIKHLYLRQLI
ncbi:ribosomal protein L18a/LX, partial [Tuber brumale]